VQINLIRKKLLDWSREQKRSLPWRGTTDPYRVWVSEVMLQQTTVAAVRERYGPFLERFPDLSSLARAREERVLAAWSGLGYYARARNLRRAAVRILRDHGGVFPRDLAALSRLPGFGEYTAAAVACLAFGSRHPAADANVTRVLSRLFAIGGPTGKKKNRAAVLDHAGKLLSSGPPGRLTATLMDLGQLICTPRRPLCVSCPLAENCLALRSGSPERYPRRARKPRAVPVFVAAACARQDGRALLFRRSATLLDRLWEFPSADAKTRASARRRLIEKLAGLGLALGGRPLGSARHTVVNRRLTIEVFPASLNRHPSIVNLQSRDSRWFTARELARAAIPTLTRKVAQAAGFLPSLHDRT
jgi:A/G-specific adenine glycosylase